MFPVRILAALLIAAVGAGGSAAESFERHVYEMPMRCDMALALDADGDGDLDLVGICRSAVMAVRLPEGEVVELFRAPDGSLIHGTAVDMDGDGDLDVAVCQFNNGWQKYREAIAEGKDWDEPSCPDLGVGWLENPGSLAQAWALHVVDDGRAGEHGSLDGTHGLASGDFDGDGTPDLVAANVGGRSVTWWPAGGERRYVDAGGAGGRPHYVAVADLDGDGRQDIALGTGGGWCLYFQRAEGWERRPLAQARGGTNVALGDIDGDGDLDLVGSAGHGQGIRWFANPDWTEGVIDAEIADVHSLAVGDLDGDGDADVVANSNARGETVVHRSDGQGGFTAEVIDRGNRQQSYGCAIVDVDADGKPDIVLGGRASRNVVWYRQR